MERVKKKINYMKHALGIDCRDFRKGQMKHKCYRNYFAIYDDEIWNELVSDGYASKIKNCDCYYVSQKGLEYLSEILDIQLELER